VKARHKLREQHRLVPATGGGEKLRCSSCRTVNSGDAAEGDSRQVDGFRTTMTSFGFDPPSVKGFTPVTDGVPIEVKLMFVRSR
jgi:LSD1 subclass zinc finger protein